MVVQRAMQSPEKDNFYARPYGRVLALYEPSQWMMLVAVSYVPEVSGRKAAQCLKDAFGGEPLCARYAYQPCSHNQYRRDISSTILSNKIAKATSWMETT